MIFLLSLVLAGLFIGLCAQPLKRHPVPFYLAAAVLSLTVIICTLARVSFPAWFQTWVWPLFSRSVLATALWAVVMWTGALPNGSKLIKKLMPIRGELSILASILTLGHNLAYGQTYFRLLFTQPARLSDPQLGAAICSLVMLCIMVPLFLTSFQGVRKRMAGSRWKKLQRLAYGFYGLLYVHVMLLTVPQALTGRREYLLNALVYSVVFLGYALCRILKAAALRAKQSDNLPRRQGAALAGALAVSLCLTGLLWGAIPSPTAQAAEEADTEPQQAETAQVSLAPQSTAAAANEITETETLPAVESPLFSGAIPTQAEDLPAQTVQPVQAEDLPAQTVQPVQAEAASPTPEPTPTPAPVRVYQNGSFTGTGEGYEGPITVSVTIQDDVITAISILSATDDDPFFSDGKAVISKILSAQSANVDTVTGATYSSGGIIDGVKAALASAKN
jgi:DMSO/TMAO reductase YedYZ heme-binding membrane subunit/uncharacterized protein with FMN-binding domain